MHAQCLAETSLRSLVQLARPGPRPMTRPRRRADPHGGFSRVHVAATHGPRPEVEGLRLALFAAGVG